MGKEFGSGSTATQSLRSTFSLAWPLLGYPSITQSSREQIARIQSYVVNNFLSLVLTYAREIVSPELGITFEPRVTARPSV